MIDTTAAHVSDRIAEILGWEPSVCVREGIARTIDWYVKNKGQKQVRNSLESMLTAR